MKKKTPLTTRLWILKNGLSTWYAIHHIGGVHKKCKIQVCQPSQILDAILLWN
jgi:hypothetical protein